MWQIDPFFLHFQSENRKYFDSEKAMNVSSVKKEFIFPTVKFALPNN